ncbi:transcriptional regulator, RpiR family [Pelagirhabdus alkalitolerans]|uniref:Transcriptional regulator, RpiR family n=1 Tax=Pelagirhabdus alkalitolerans TaxID=1612202 RepID=A0A1G6GJ69_9BACI|nr:MurR/RpiR family transcriptional regulator [Pelagirhabdus alkalitolerans]SDB81969.1 transcriptional regulator, RpiR family [Pelagirhabdus alkalitolerans]
MSSILNQIQLYYQTLSKLEKKVADYVLKNHTKIANMHIKDLAYESGVSVATITRFSRKIGADSFVEFKISLRDAIDIETESNDVIQTVNNMYKSVVEATSSLSTLDIYFEAIQHLKAAKRIHIFGLGSSGLSGEELKLRLQRMGYMVNTYHDSHSMILSSSIMDHDDCILAISSSGETKEIIDSLKLAKSNNASILIMTNYVHTQMTKYADTTLFTYSMQNYKTKNLLNSQLSILYVIDVLTMLLMQDGDNRKNYDKTLNALKSYKHK